MPLDRTPGKKEELQCSEPTATDWKQNAIQGKRRSLRRGKERMGVETQTLKEQRMERAEEETAEERDEGRCPGRKGMGRLNCRPTLLCAENSTQTIPPTGCGPASDGHGKGDLSFQLLNFGRPAICFTGSLGRLKKMK